MSNKKAISLYVYPTDDIVFQEKGWRVIGTPPSIQVNYKGLAYCISFGPKEVELEVLEQKGGNMGETLLFAKFEDGKLKE